MLQQATERHGARTEDFSGVGTEDVARVEVLPFGGAEPRRHFLRLEIAPLLDHFAATYTGISTAELMSDRSKRIGAVIETMQGLGPWDMSFAAETANEALLKWAIAARLKTPGKELPPNEIHQFEETETLKVDDYDRLSEMGVSQFQSMVRRRLPILKNSSGRISSTSPTLPSNPD